MGITEIFDNNLHKFLPFEPNPHIAIAVSGGADSLALMLLAQYWIKKISGTLTILTIDHQLRSESQDEAHYVYNICKKFSLNHKILTWKHESINSNIQSLARTARYNLLTEYCKKNDILHLMTAHHADDNIENLLIRMLRGSGIMGLSSHHLFYYNNVRILRPLFNLTKQDLEQYLTEHKLSWITDPSNDSEKYLRTQVRKLLKSSILSNHMDHSLVKKRLSLSQKNLNHALTYMQKEVIYYYAHSIKFNSLGFVIINKEIFREAGPEICSTIFSILLMLISGNIMPPRFESLQKIVDSMSNPNSIKTLHGCKIKNSSDKILICREYGKNPPIPQLLYNNIIWDNRFKVIIHDKLDISNLKLMVDKFTMQDYINLKRKVKNNIFYCFSHYREILFTLPVIKDLEKVVSIPHIDYHDHSTIEKKVNFIFKPSLLSRWVHFC